ncbi:hypothetical protein D3C73_1614430 [compost metagenome]
MNLRLSSVRHWLVVFVSRVLTHSTDCTTSEFSFSVSMRAWVATCCTAVRTTAPAFRFVVANMPSLY